MYIYVVIIITMCILFKYIGRSPQIFNVEKYPVDYNLYMRTVYMFTISAYMYMQYAQYMYMNF